MAKLKVEFMIDTEADFYYAIPSPHFTRKDLLKWKLNKLIGRAFRYPWPSRRGILNIIASLKKYTFPATFCIVGHLFLKRCNGFRHFSELRPRNQWYSSKIGRDWYYWDRGGNYKTHPGLFFGDIIEKEKENSLFRFGLHAFSHEALTLESSEIIDSIISSGMQAAKSIGIKPNSFAAPFELTQDISDPNKIFSVLRKYKIKKVFFAGADKGLTKLRKMQIASPTVEDKLEKVRISNYFEGTSSRKYLKNILSEIRKNKGQGKTYCLVTHDFTHKNTKNLDFIMSNLKNMERAGEIEIV